MNPLTTLLDQLQKLLNEHASAAVLRDHVALLRDQITIQEKTLEALKSENAEIKGRLAKYESQPGETCPMCRKPTLALASSKPNAIFGNTGLNDYSFTCSACGFTDEISEDSAGRAWLKMRGH